MQKEDPIYNSKLLEAVEKQLCLYDYNLKEYEIYEDEPNHRQITNHHLTFR